ncbi:Chromosomal replication initiator protein DnaA [hydrothermal vent metagenome]|uniref:Chromosomal replication initiator protein DnaA n=1 Tax=hydrothermal vent metagenome TaxID=652676 RepID=A0A3B1CLC8_9ZZZZ
MATSFGQKVGMLSVSLWNFCKSELRKKLNPHNYDSWIDPITFVSINNESITLSVPSTFYIDWIQEHYKKQMEEIFEEKALRPVGINFTVTSKPSKDSSKKGKGNNSTARKAVKAKSYLDDKFTFDNFVVGKSNEFCNACCMAVAANIGRVYNPLFIYGGVGLGKTHLLQAIGHAVLKKNKNANILYLTSEKFVNSLINSLQHGAMPGFRQKYRNLDVLLVDDIQFIAGKERTQEEFFHTFNSLFELKKQIVITSDKFPKDMKNLEERLRSRFAWGLIADIQPPELEIKIAILKKIAKRNNIHLDEDVAAFLAEKIKSNIRELEGCLIRVMAYASLTGKKIDIDFAAETLKGIYDDAVKTVDIRQIQKAVCDFYGIKLSEIKSKSRSKNIALPRHVASYLCREYTNSSLPEIGRSFGGRDHTTVMHSVSRIKHEIEVNTQIYNEINEIKRTMDL